MHTATKCPDRRGRKIGVILQFPGTTETAFPMLSRVLLLTAYAIGTVGFVDSIADEPLARGPTEETEHESQHFHKRSPIRRYGFSEGVLALTWDDGPDRNTM